MAFSFSPKIVTNGLVLYLDAGNSKSYPGTGLTWSDLSRSGNNGTLTPGASGLTFNSSNGGSLVFDGVDDFISIPDINITTQISVEAWVYANSVGAYNSMVAQYSANNPSTSSWILETFGSSAYFFIANGSNLASGNVVFDTLRWTHYVGTYDGVTVRIFKNGTVSPTTGTSAAINNSSLNINIGALYSSGGVQGGDGRWNGRIAATKIYNRALSASEVLQNYNATKSRFGL
jgi:hypothetical protein